MLVLTRKSEESILIGDNVEVVILEIRGSVVRIGIKAPREISVVRSEIAKRGLPENLHQDAEGTKRSLPGSLTATDESSTRLLQNFCEHRKAWRTTNIEPSAPEMLADACVMHFG